MIRIRLSIEGDVVVDRLLQGIEARAKDLTPAWPGVVKAFQAIVARAFDSEGGSSGAPWQPLATSTVKDRVRAGFPGEHPILERTGALKRALTIGEGAYIAMSPSSMRYQLMGELGYFAYHQSTAPRRKLPRRPMINLTFDDRTALMQPIRLYLTGRNPNAWRQAATV